MQNRSTHKLNNANQPACEISGSNVACETRETASTSAKERGLHPFRSEQAHPRMRASEIAELALMCALMTIGKEALRMIPNVHPVALIIMLCVIRYGWKTIYPVAGFVALQISLYGFGLWNLMYIYVWPLLVLMCMPIRNSRKWWLWAIVAGLHGFAFGAMCAVPYIFTSGWKAAVAYWISGIPFDITHGISNFVIVLLLLPILTKALARVNRPGSKTNPSVR